MKKIILVFVVVCFLSAAGFYAYQEFFLQKDLVPEDLVPFGVVAYSHTYDLEEKLAAFSKTSLAQGFSKLSIDEFMDKMGAQPHEKMIVKMVLDQINSETNRQLASQFLGKEVAVSVYATDKTEFGPEMWMDAASNIMIITRLKPEVRFVELIAPVFSKFNQEISEEETSYKKHSIHLLSVANTPVKIGYVRFGDLLVFGWGERAAQRAIDVVSGDVQSLAADPQFREAFPSQNEREDKAFFNYAVFAKKMKDYILASANKAGSELDQQGREQFEESFKQMNGFKAMASVVRPGAVTAVQTSIYYDPAQMHPDVLPFYQARPQENKSLNFIPADVVTYQWQSGIDFRQYWLQAEKRMRMIAERTGDAEGAGSPDLFIQAMESQAGMSIEKGILPLFGDEMGGFLLDIDAMGPFPLPKLAVFIEVTNEAAVTELLNKLLDALSFVRIEHEEYQNVFFRYATVPMLEGFTPACGVFDHYVTCATSRDLFKSMIDLSKGGEKKGLSLKDNRIFSNPQYKLTRPANGVFFVNVSSLMDKLIVLTDVFEQWMLMQQSQQTALRSGAQKRLEDINAKISQNQEAFAAVEEELVGLRGQDSAAPPVDESRITGIAQDIDRQQKIRESFQGRLKELLKEEEALLAVEKVEGQQLSDDGKVRLAEVQEDLILQQERLADSENKISGLTQKQQELSMAVSSSADIAQTVSLKEKKLLQIRDEIRDDEEVRQEIDVLLEGYNNQDIPSDQERTFLVNGVIKPILTALKNIHWVGGRMEIQERAIKSDMLFEYE